MHINDCHPLDAQPFADVDGVETNIGKDLLKKS